MIKRILIFTLLFVAILTIGFYASNNDPRNIADNPTPKINTPSSEVPKTVQPPKTKGTPFRFIAMADSRGLDRGINSKVIKKTLESIKKLSPQPEFAIMPGDLCDGAKTYTEVKTQMQYFKKVVTSYYPVEFFYPGIGNHEVRSNSNGEKAFGEVFTEFRADNFLDGYNRSVYYFDRNNIRFFMLNTNHPGENNSVSDKQLNWLKSNIDKSKGFNMFALHEPPFPTGSHVGSSLDANRLKRDKLWQVIDNSANPMVFCGHEHNYTRRHIDSSFSEKVKGTEFKFTKSVYQITIGSFGAPLYTKYTSKKNVDVPPIAKYHYSVIDIYGNSIKATVYDVDGKVIDTFEQSKW